MATNIVKNSNIDAGMVKSPITINNAQTDSENAAKTKKCTQKFETNNVS